MVLTGSGQDKTSLKLNTFTLETSSLDGVVQWRLKDARKVQNFKYRIDSIHQIGKDELSVLLKQKSISGPQQSHKKGKAGLSGGGHSSFKPLLVIPGFDPEHLPYLVEEEKVYDTSLGESVATLIALKGLKVIAFVYPERSKRQAYVLTQVPRCRQVTAKQLAGMPRIMTDGLINESL